MKAIQRAEHTEAMVDGLGSGLRLFVELIADVIEQSRFIHLGQRRLRDVAGTSERSAGDHIHRRAAERRDSWRMRWASRKSLAQVISCPLSSTRR